MPVEQLTDEQASAIWTGDTASLMGLTKKEEPEVKVPEKVEGTNTLQKEEKVYKVEETPHPSDEDINKALAPDEEEEEEGKTTTSVHNKTGEEAKRGRKPSDIVSMVNQLVEEEVLFGFEDGEAKTIEEAKELIKSNIKQQREASEDDMWKERVRSKYSPQVQAIIHYAEQGAQSATQLMDLLGAIRDVEDVNDLDTTSTEGRKEIIRQAYKARGFRDAYVEKQVNTYADLGEDKLKEAADELFPELAEMAQVRVAERLREEAEREQEAQEAKKVYISTIKQTLDKDIVGSVRLQREDRAKIIDAIAVNKYTSLNGQATTGFIKALEDMQFGKNADYGHFLNVVHHAIDPKGFLDKANREAKNETASADVRKVKSAKSSSPSTEEQLNTGSSKRTIKKDEFRNPYL